MHTIHTPHPTDHAAFKRMISTMSIEELDDLSKTINADIEYYGTHTKHNHNIQWFVEEDKLIEKELSERRILKLELD